MALNVLVSLRRTVRRRLRSWLLELLSDDVDVAAEPLDEAPAEPPQIDDGPPAHWVERVKHAAPQLLRPRGAGLAASPLSPLAPSAPATRIVSEAYSASSRRTAPLSAIPNSPPRPLTPPPQRSQRLPPSTEREIVQRRGQSEAAYAAAADARSAPANPPGVGNDVAGDLRRSASHASAIARDGAASPNFPHRPAAASAEHLSDSDPAPDATRRSVDAPSDPVASDDEQHAGALSDTLAAPLSWPERLIEKTWIKETWVKKIPVLLKPISAWSHDLSSPPAPRGTMPCDTIVQKVQASEPASPLQPPNERSNAQDIRWQDIRWQDFRSQDFHSDVSSALSQIVQTAERRDGDGDHASGETQATLNAEGATARSQVRHREEPISTWSGGVDRRTTDAAALPAAAPLHTPPQAHSSPQSDDRWPSLDIAETPAAAVPHVQQQHGQQQPAEPISQYAVTALGAEAASSPDRADRPSQPREFVVVAEPRWAASSARADRWPALPEPPAVADADVTDWLAELDHRKGLHLEQRGKGRWNG